MTHAAAPWPVADEPSAEPHVEALVERQLTDTHADLVLPERLLGVPFEHAELAYLGIMTPGEITLNVVRNDPADNRYLECAVEGAADYLVSGDQDLLDLHEHGGIRIVNPKTFSEVLRAHDQQGGPGSQED